ncbi:MAG: tRNA-dihydrouridine synthase [Elusimicrobia bacterium]|nr:tRNA-dihydrouridine synthase [Elusimicrobiota bacterium]
MSAAAGHAAPLSLRERFDLLREHARLIVEYYGESLGLRRLRKYLPSYVHGLPHAAAFRGAANRIERHAEFLEFLASFEARGGSFLPSVEGKDTMGTL